MDDPWGSPWADEHNDTTVAPSKVKPIAPAKTPFEEKEAPLPTWGDNDDGFGEWSSMPADVVAPSGGFESGASSYTWDVSDKKTNQGQLDGLNGHSISWNHPSVEDDRNETPRLSPRESSRIVRQPSPDPWATKFADDNITHVEDVEELDFTGHEVDSDDTVVLELPGLTASEPVSSSEDFKRAEEDALEEHTIVPMERYSTEEKTKQLAKPLEVTSQRHEVDHESSRSSPSPSDHSPSEDIPDSPRTSLEEDPKRPQLPRQVSSKVQDLVEHFDNLTKDEAAEELVADTKAHEEENLSKDVHSIQNPDIVDESIQYEDDGDDFGDFEEGQSAIGDEEPPTIASPSESQNKNVPLPTTPEVPAPLSKYGKKDFGRIEFPVDRSCLAEIFSDMNDLEPENVFIPDVIPHDSFSSVEQRKTWYRISRYGAMKRHDMGDDENYVRTTWAQSQARAGTLRIVARWMEEDRISGRVVLGGGSKGSSLFGWNDSSAGAVPLASAFAKPTQKTFQIQTVPDEPAIPREWPKGLAKTRSTSRTRPPSKLRRRSSTKSSNGSVDIKREVTMPVKSFGWSSEDQDTRPLATTLQVKRHSPIPEKQTLSGQQEVVPPDVVLLANSSKQEHTPQGHGASSLSPIMQTPTTMIASPVVVPLHSVNNMASDDDWGEMVSTPIDNVAAKFPPPEKVPSNTVSPPSLATITIPSLQETTLDNMSSPSTFNPSHVKANASGLNTKGPSEPVASSVDKVLFNALGSSSASEKNILAGTKNFSADDLDPWGSPSLGDSIENNNGSLFDAFNGDAVSTSRLIPRSTEAKLDPWETARSTGEAPSIEAFATLDASGSKPHFESDISDQNSVVSASQAASSTTDSWGSVDFSFFDTPIVPKSAVKPKATALSVTKSKKSVGFSTVKPQVKHSPSPLSQATTLKTSTTLANTTATPPVQVGRQSKEATEKENIVVSIIKGLPDLSYMLRR